MPAPNSGALNSSTPKTVLARSCQAGAGPLAPSRELCAGAPGERRWRSAVAPAHTASINSPHQDKILPQRSHLQRPPVAPLCPKDPGSCPAAVGGALEQGGSVAPTPGLCPLPGHVRPGVDVWPRLSPCSRLLQSSSLPGHRPPLLRKGEQAPAIPHPQHNLQLPLQLPGAGHCEFHIEAQYSLHANFGISA